MKNLNPPPLFSRDIHEKTAKSIFIVIGIVLVYGLIGLLFREPLEGIFMIAAVYAVLVLNTRYPRVNHRRRRFPKQK